MSTLRFEKELSYLKLQRHKDILKKCIDVIPDYFYVIPASSTGKYHPNYALGEGGLYRHTCAAMKIANELLSLEQFSIEFTETKQDAIYTALLLHDTLKNGLKYSKYTLHEHPILAAEYYLDILKEEPNFAEYVVGAISSHMGQWNTSKYSSTVLPKPNYSNVETFVHMCDYLASRKDIEILLSPSYYSKLEKE